MFQGDQRGGYNNRGFDRGNDRHGNRVEQDSNLRRGNLSSSSFERNDSYGNRYGSREAVSLIQIYICIKGIGCIWSFYFLNMFNLVKTKLQDPFYRF